MSPGRVAPAPPGYERTMVGSVEVVAVARAMGDVVHAVSGGSLYDYARVAATRVLQGRSPVYVAPLPGGTPVVAVRHSRHGGMFARLTGDRFPGRTRAPRELAMSARLATIGIPTPTLIAYVVYPAGPLLRRSDIATEFIDHSADLAAVLCGGSEIDRTAAVRASATLLVAMARGGVRHPDLNLKNILVASPRAGAVRAYLLDVDRVLIDPSRARAAAANAGRLARSARRWRERRNVAISEQELALLEGGALGRTP